MHRYTYISAGTVKTKLTLTIDEELVPRAKALARRRGLSLSQLVENSLREMEGAEGQSFSETWKGKLVLADRDGESDERFRALVEKYL